MDENKKQTSGKKKIIAILASVIVGVAVLVGVIFFINSDSGYRLIKIYQVNGSALLDRKKTGIMDAYENLIMQRDDQLTVDTDSNVRLQMDEDKYALAEENTILSIEAEGDSENSKTNIILKQGAVTIEIQNKLSSQSTYQVTTPNAVMAVRGTVFRVTADTDDAGNYITKVDILEGTVAIQKREKDGTLSKETLVDRGKHAEVKEESANLILTINEDIPYEDLPVYTLNFLQEISESHGRELDISQEEIQRLLTEKIKEVLPEDNNEATDADNKEKSDKQEDTIEETADQKPSKPKLPDNPGKIQDKTETTEDSGETPAVIPGTPVVPAQNATVTFLYDGTVFATQQVAVGSTVQKPKLQPETGGEWDFDFTQPIAGDTTIEYKE